MSTSGEIARTPAFGNTSERRQVSVIFCDIVQSTAMSCTLDPEDLWAVFHRYREVVRHTVRAFGGIICHHKGDGILCCFGYPATHEDNASRAVQAALGVLARLDEQNGAGLEGETPLRLRIGIATGEVAIVDNRAHDPDGLELLGPAPSLAARLQSGANENTALADDTTFRLTRNDFRFAPAQTTRLKGFRGALTVHRPMSPARALTRFERGCGTRLTRFVNRQHEQGEMTRAWQATCEGRGQVVLLAGEPGIGKSRLVRHFLKRLGPNERHDIKLQCSSLHTRTPLHPFVAGLSHFIGLDEVESEEAKICLLRTFLGDLGVRDGYCVPLLAHLVDLPAAQCLPLLSALTSKEIRRRATALLAACLEALAERHPIVLVAEDLHWADRASLGLINALAASVADHRVLILATYRPAPHEEESPLLAGLQGAPNCRVLTLERLSRQHSAKIASDVVRQAGETRLPDEWIARIVERSDGVPLFIEELTRTILDKVQEEPAFAQRPWVKGAADGIPATLRDSLAARLDTLQHGAPGGPTPKRLAQIGACIGREFSQETLTRLVRATGASCAFADDGARLEEKVQEGLERLVEADLIRRTDRTETTYRFKHALVQDAAYAGLWREDKKRIHLRMLDLIRERREAGGTDMRPELLANHARAAGQVETAARHWLTAGQLEAARSNMKEARTDYREALRIAGELPTGTVRDNIELEGHIALGSVFMAEKGFATEDVEQQFKAAARIAERLGEEHHLYLPAQLGRQLTLIVHGRHRKATRLARQCLTIARRTGEPALEIEGLRHLGIALFWCGRPREACRHLSLVPALYDRTRHASLSVFYGSDPCAGSLAFLSLSQAQMGLTETALETNRQSLRMAMELNQAQTTGYALLCRAMLLHMLALAESGAAAQTALEFCQRRALPFWGRWAQVLRGHAMIRTGDAAEGLRMADAGYEAFTDAGSSMVRPYLLSIRADGNLALGMREAAVAQLEEASTIAANTQEGVCEGEIWRRQAGLMEENASFESTYALYQRALTHTRQRGMRLYEARTALDFAHWLARCGRVAEALKIARKSLQRCRAGEDKAGIARLEGFVEAHPCA